MTLTVTGQAGPAAEDPRSRGPSPPSQEARSPLVPGPPAPLKRRTALAAAGTLEQRDGHDQRHGADGAGQPVFHGRRAGASPGSTVDARRAPSTPTPTSADQWAPTGTPPILPNENVAFMTPPELPGPSGPLDEGGSVPRGGRATGEGPPRAGPSAVRGPFARVGHGHTALSGAAGRRSLTGSARPPVRGAHTRRPPMPDASPSRPWRRHRAVAWAAALIALRITGIVLFRRRQPGDPRRRPPCQQAGAEPAHAAPGRAPALVRGTA